MNPLCRLLSLNYHTSISNIFLIFISFFVFSSATPFQSEEDLYTSHSLLEKRDLLDAAQTCVPSCLHGTCSSRMTQDAVLEYFCKCDLLYYGTDCSIRWWYDLQWREVFIAYQVVTLILNMINICFGGYQVYITIKYGKILEWSKWNVVTWTLAFIISGCVGKYIIHLGPQTD
jgi:hypothetical protein